GRSSNEQSGDKSRIDRRIERAVVVVVGNLLNQRNALLRGDFVLIGAIARDRVSAQQSVLLRHIQPPVWPELHRGRARKSGSIAERRFGEADLLRRRIVV